MLLMDYMVASDSLIVQAELIAMVQCMARAPHDPGLGKALQVDWQVAAVHTQH